MLESIAARPFLPVGLQVGRCVAAPATTAGKLMLAALPPLLMAALVTRRGLQRVGPKGITGVERDLAELERVRAHWLRDQ